MLAKELIDRYYEEMFAKGEITHKNVQEKNVLIFTNSSISTDDVTEFLNQNNIQTTKLHSKMKVNDRIRSLSEFKEGKYMVMVATDVGARGLDFEDLDLVIQFDFAKNATTLLHRFGRTGRLNKPGKVISFVDEGDALLFWEFEDRRKEGKQMGEILSRNRSFSRTRKYEEPPAN
jgi:superfamily II DNA/RNA helicase